jgi:hypothetical protein
MYVSVYFSEVMRPYQANASFASLYCSYQQLMPYNHDDKPKTLE